MIYADLNSFFACEVSSALIKQDLLWKIAVAKEEKQLTFDEEYNVFRLLIRYEEGHVELWHTLMMYEDEAQEPCAITLEDFLAALKTHVPPR